MPRFLKTSIALVVALIGLAAAAAGMPASSPADAALPENRVFLPMVMAGLASTPTLAPTLTSTAVPTATNTPPATPLPTATSTPLPTPCNTSAQVLANTSFETGIPPWTISGLTTRTNYTSYDGLYSMQLGDYNNAQDGLGQTGVVPSWAQNGAIYFAWEMFSSDSTIYGYDELAVGVFDSSNNLIASMGVWNNGTRGVWEPTRLPIPNVSAYAGQPLTVLFGGFTDPTFPTVWYVDKVWMVFGCGSQTTALTAANAPTSVTGNAPGALSPERLRQLETRLRVAAPKDQVLTSNPR